MGLQICIKVFMRRYKIVCCTLVSMIINSNGYRCAVVLKQIDHSGDAMISDSREFEAKLVYIVRFRPTSAAYSGPQKNENYFICYPCGFVVNVSVVILFICCFCFWQTDDFIGISYRSMKERLHIEVRVT